MNGYDDDRVIALLRDAVPAVPDLPDRVLAVQRRAGRQRAVLWTQTLAASVVVLVIVGVASAVSGAGGSNRVQPTRQPIDALTEALAGERSVRFEASMELIGEPPRDTARMSAEQLEDLMASRVTGAATRDGDFTMAGDLSALNGWWGGYGGSPEAERDFRVIVVDGLTYRSPLSPEEVPPGKSWVLDPSGDSADIDDLLRTLRAVGSIAENVEYVGSGEVRGTDVGRYRLDIPAEVTAGSPVRVAFALDAENRLRQVTAEFSWAAMMGGYEEQSATAEPSDSFMTLAPQAPPHPLMVRVRLDLFDYGADVGIQAPPASEVAEQPDVSIVDPDGPSEEEMADFMACMENAESPDDAQECNDLAGGSYSDVCWYDSYGGKTCKGSPSGSQPTASVATPAGPPPTSSVVIGGPSMVPSPTP